MSFLSSHSSDASDTSVASMAPEVEAGDILSSSTSSYSVQEFIGEGAFGRVARCQKMETKEVVAVKILKDFFVKDQENELSMLEHISVLNPDRTNIVKFYEQFDHMGQFCLAFEMLDVCLYDLVEERNSPLSIKEIRPIAQQLLVALDALKGLGVLHTDIKPDNVMLVNNQVQPFRIKLIDFGEAISIADIEPGLVVQPAGYRAPEVALGLPFTEAIDVWGAGCVLAYLYLADHLFPFFCVYQMIKRIVEVLGQPEDDLLSAGRYTDHFFSQEESADGPTWRLMTPGEYADANDLIAQEENNDADLPRSLDCLVKVYPRESADEFVDRLAFIDLLKQLLHLVGDQRISPRQALQHSFISMSHLTEHSDYLITSRTLMSFCPMEDRVNITAATTGSFSDEDPAAPFDCWSDEGKSDVTYDIESLNCSSDEGISDVTYDIQSIDCTSEEGKSDATYDIEPSNRSSDGHSLSGDDDLAHWSFQRVQSPWLNDGAKTPDYTVEVSGGSGLKLLKRIRKFFSRVATTFSCCCHPTVED